MSSHGSSLPDVSIQRADINSQLNATLLGIFMMGMYTIVYFGTLYICLTRKRSPGKVVISSISLLYALGIIEYSFEWTFMEWFFLENGDTRVSIFKALLVLPRWLHVMNNIFAFIMLTLADGLLIWRCFHVWNRSIRVIFLPLFLFFGEIGSFPSSMLGECAEIRRGSTGLFLSAVIILFVTKAQPTHQQALTVDRIESAGYFVSATTSLATTFLIAYRINNLSKDGLSESRGRFKHVVEILVQSVFVYSLALLVQAIAVVVPFAIGNSRLFALETYSAAILIPITGIAPTIMVARVNLAAGEGDLWPRTRYSTGLRFRSQEGTENQSDTQVIGEENTEKQAVEYVSRGEP
ncbi:hypothetical protein CVT25_015081 [Psilocybe cyanescens]|uniref:Uncharacterized protein n=1 Tax=Psilocybe cyanescens TaxID=93625 RepID=A0A409WS19_PSICY|nr:hypothetical protein CVT25_015081 [Psilocybe cyanescens]